MSDEQKDFGPFLVNRFGESYLPSVNRELFSKVGSDAYYAGHYQEGLHGEDTLYLIVGTDAGLLPKWIIRKGVPEGALYLFIEVPEIIERLEEVFPAKDRPMR